MKKRNICVSAAAVMTAVMLYGCAGSSVPAETAASANVAASAENGKESVENEQKTETAEAGEATAAVTETAEDSQESLGLADAGAAETLAVIEDEAVPLYQKPAGSDVRTPVASGSVTYGNGRATIDASNTSKGYVMIKYTGGQSRIKIQIAKSTTYTYDLNARDAYEVFPFTEGSGTYSIKIFENVSGNQYAQVMSQNVSVSLSDEFAPFLTPNQYVNFWNGSAAVNKGAELAASAADAIGVVTNVYNYVINNITYDTARAASVQSGYLPNVDQVLAERKGICFDYAALMTAMLRSQDIPTKLVIGYSGGLYHAWVNVYIDNVGWVDNFIYFDGHNWSIMDPTFASSGGQSESIKQYIGNGSNYQAKYTY